MSGEIHFVLGVDAEGPLYESPAECIRRVNSLFGLDLDPGEESLRLLQEKRLDIGGKEAEIAQMVSPRVRDWIGSWDGVLDNVRQASSERFRSQLVDDEGRGLVFNWFVCDWVGFTHNPRRKPIGLNLVFDHYWDLFAKDQEHNPIYFHHHAEPLSECTHHPCRNWTNIPTHVLKLSANLLEYGHFPACVRSPIMAPDIHYFLEQFFPFDLSNTAVPADGQPDILGRRWTDWTKAPSDWSVYHPDWYDYQLPGPMRRAVGRCMQYGSRYGNLDEKELQSAFARADRGEQVLVSCYVHDHSPMDKLEPLFQTIARVRRAYPGVRYHNASAVSAFRRVLELDPGESLRLTLTLEDNVLLCRSNKDIFGPQPWLCFKSKDGRHHWDNMDILDGNVWRYIFDQYTTPLENVCKIAVAANDACGNTGRNSLLT